MKDFLVMCAKIALGIFIGFVLIFGGTNSLDKKAQQIKSDAVTELSKISFSTTTTTSDDH